MEFGIEKYASNEKQQTTSDWWNGTTMSRHDKNARKKGNVQILGHLGGWHHQTSQEERTYQKQIDQRTKKKKKIMTMHKARHPIDDIDRLYVLRKKGLTSIEDSVNASIQWHHGLIVKHDGGLITATRNDTDNTITNRMTINRKQKLEEKQLYGLFKRLITSCTWNLDLVKKRKL